MKFLHLSDLHIGKNLNGFSMIGEQKNAFEQVLGYIKSEKPDAVIIAGDVYDRAVPNVEAVRAFDDFLTELAGTNVAVLIISGNHDSPERIDYASRLLSDRHIYFYGAFDGTLRKVVLNDEHGEVTFWLLPFIKPADDIIAAMIEAAGIDYAARNVLVSHQFYTKAGVTPIRSESELCPVGGLDAVDAGIIEGFDYIALGHLHGGQGIGSEHIRYCGSPVKYSFSECRQKKSVTSVELAEKGSLTVKLLPLVPLHDMREIKGDLDRLMSEDVSRLEDREDYLRVILTDEEEIIDPMGKLRSVYPNIMSLDFDNSRTGIDIDAITTDTESVEKLSPYELFAEFFLDVQGSTMSKEQAEIVRGLLERPDEE